MTSRIPVFVLRLFCAAAVSAITSASPVSVRAATLEGRISATGQIGLAKPLSVAVDSWVCGKDGFTPDPRLVIDKRRGLANVIVRLDGVKDAPPFPKKDEPVVIDQKGCVFEPHVVLVGPGQEVEVRNSDSVLHNFRTVSKKNKVINKAQPKGVTVKSKFGAPENIIVQCDVHYWMSAVVAVAEHGLTTVTDSEGKFRLDGIPPGQYVVNLWHEKLGLRRPTVEIRDKGGRLDFMWAESNANTATEPPVFHEHGKACEHDFRKKKLREEAGEGGGKKKKRGKAGADAKAGDSSEGKKGAGGAASACAAGGDCAASKGDSCPCAAAAAAEGAAGKAAASNADGKHDHEGHDHGGPDHGGDDHGDHGHGDHVGKGHDHGKHDHGDHDHDGAGAEAPVGNAESAKAGDKETPACDCGTKAPEGS